MRQRSLFRVSASVCFCGLLLVPATRTAAIAGDAVSLSDKYNSAALENSFSKFDRPGISDLKAMKFLDVFAPILGGHPESMEGNAAARIAYEKKSDGTGYVVEIEQDGLLDDSVSAQKFIGFVVPAKDGGWQLESLWLRQKCARGKAAGKWVKGNCG